MRKSPTISERVCERCGVTYIPNGPTQRYCVFCKTVVSKERKRIHYEKTHPNRKPKTKCTDLCCVCGGKFAGMYDGKPYCNKHWLRLYNNGTLEPKRRAKTSRFVIDGDKLKIITFKGDEITADADQYEKLSKYSWCIDPKGYAVANIGGEVTSMHRYLLGLKRGDPRIGDHRNRDTSDYRMQNLRVCTPKGNARNVSVAKSNKLGVLGVRITEHGKFNVRIVADGVEHYIGNFDTLDMAVEARIKAEKTYHGEFASHLGDEHE